MLLMTIRTPEVTEALNTERAAISREIHDNLGQELTTLRLAMRHFYRENTTSELIPEAVRKEFLTLMAQVDRTIKAARKLAYSLRTDIVETKGLALAVESLVSEVREISDINGKLQLIAGWQDPPEALAQNMYRCVQELLNNVIKHSRATNFILRLGIEGGKYWISIMDDGVGFPEGLLNKKLIDDRLGLKSLLERARLFGGDVQFKSRPHVQGTFVHIEFFQNSYL